MKGGLNSKPLASSSYTGSQANKTGIYALEKADLFNLLCIPPDTRDGDTRPATSTRRRMQLLRRAARHADRRSAGRLEPTGHGRRDAATRLPTSASAASTARNAALYFPRVRQADPLREGQLDTFVPCGVVAGVMARTDAQRGVWKAPAGIDADAERRRRRCRST